MFFVLLSCSCRLCLSLNTGLSLRCCYIICAYFTFSDLFSFFFFTFACFWLMHVGLSIHMAPSFCPLYVVGSCVMPLYSATTRPEPAHPAPPAQPACPTSIHSHTHTPSPRRLSHRPHLPLCPLPPGLIDMGNVGRSSHLHFVVAGWCAVMRGRGEPSQRLFVMGCGCNVSGGATCNGLALIGHVMV